MTRVSGHANCVHEHAWFCHEHHLHGRVCVSTNVHALQKSDDHANSSVMMMMMMLMIATLSECLRLQTSHASPRVCLALIFAIPICVGRWSSVSFRRGQGQRDGRTAFVRRSP